MNDTNDRRQRWFYRLFVQFVRFVHNDEWMSLMGIESRSCEKNKSEMTKTLFHSAQTDPISVNIPGITEINLIPITSQKPFLKKKNNWISPETKQSRSIGEFHNWMFVLRSLRVTKKARRIEV